MKKARRKSPQKSAPDFFDSIDKVLDHCLNIETLTEWLKGCENAEGLEPKTIANTAYLVLMECKKLRAALDDLCRTLPHEHH